MTPKRLATTPGKAPIPQQPTVHTRTFLGPPPSTQDQQAPTVPDFQEELLGFLPTTSLLPPPRKYSTQSPDPSEGSADTVSSVHRPKLEKRPRSISSDSSVESLPPASAKAPAVSKSGTKFRKVFSSSSGSIQSVYELIGPPPTVPDQSIDIPDAEADEEERLRQMDIEWERAQRAIDIADMTDMWTRLASTPTADDDLILVDTLSPGLLTLLNRGRVFAQLVDDLGVNRATKRARILVRNQKKTFQGGQQDFESARQRYNTAVMNARNARPPPTTGVQTTKRAVPDSTQPTKRRRRALL